MNRILILTGCCMMLVSSAMAADTEYLLERAPQVNEANKTTNNLTQALGLSTFAGLNQLAAHHVNHKVVTRYQQTYKGVPVFGRHIIVTTSAKGIVALHGHAVYGIEADIATVNPQMTAIHALAIAKEYEIATDHYYNERSQLVIYAEGPITKLAYAISYYKDKLGGAPARPYLILEANTGAMLTHGFTQQTTELINENQTGAIAGEAAEYIGENPIDTAYDFYLGLGYAGEYSNAFYLLATTPGWNTGKANDLVKASQLYWTPLSSIETVYQGSLSAAADLGYNLDDVTAAFAIDGVVPSSVRDQAQKANLATTRINNNDVVDIGSIDAKDWRRYVITVPASAINLTVTTTGMSGDADLYLGFDAPPNEEMFDTSSTTPTSTETVTNTSPNTGDHYIGIFAWSATTGITLTVTYELANQPPTAAFAVASNGLFANFTDTSTDSDGTLASYAWDFGDGATSADSDPWHIYTAAGTYTVTLTVTDNDGATNSLAQQVSVALANQPPQAGFSVSTMGLTATFTDASTDNDGTLLSRTWNFGDSSSSTNTNPSHTYAAAGTYAVTLTVTDNDGATNALSQAVSVTAPPQAGFTVTTLDLTATFTDTSTDSDGTIASHAWDFGDGATSTNTNPSHTYATSGTYTVTLTVTDDDGATDTSTLDVDVNRPEGELSNGVPVTQLWDSQDGWQIFYIDVPPDTVNLEVQMSGGFGDADLYVNYGSEPTLNNYSCRPFREGNWESCDEITPQAGRYYVGIYAYTDYDEVTLVATYNQGCSYSDSLDEISGGIYSWRNYYQDVAPCASTLIVTIDGGTGDCDLYLRFDGWPTRTNYDCASYRYGNSDSCTIQNPDTGTWYISLFGYTPYSGVTLEAIYY